MRKPKYVHVRLCLTNACPSECKLCYRRHLDKTIDPTMMTNEIALESIGWIYGNLDISNNFHLFLWGGEPLLNWKVFKSLVQIYPQIRFETNTSGELFGEEQYDVISDQTGHLDLTWSMLNAYERYGGIRNKVESQTWLTRYALENRVIINVTVTNYKNMVDDYKYLKSMGFGNIAVQNLLGVEISDADLEVYMDNLLEIFLLERDGREGFIEKSSYWARECGSGDFVKDNFCSSGLTKLFIDTSGGIWQCDGFYINRQNKLGTIRDGVDWDKLDIQMDRWRDQKKIMKQYCEGCEIEDICPNTKCLATNWLHNKDYLKPYPGFCKFQRAMVGMFKKYRDTVRKVNA